MKPPPPRFDASRFEIQKIKGGEIFICRETLLPAYKDKADYDAQGAKLFPRAELDKLWRCGHCGRYHAQVHFLIGTKMRQPRSEKTLMEALDAIR